MKTSRLKSRKRPFLRVGALVLGHVGGVLPPVVLVDVALVLRDDAPPLADRRVAVRLQEAEVPVEVRFVLLRQLVAELALLCPALEAERAHVPLHGPLSRLARRTRGQVVLDDAFITQEHAQANGADVSLPLPLLAKVSAHLGAHLGRPRHTLRVNRAVGGLVPLLQGAVDDVVPPHAEHHPLVPPQHLSHFLRDPLDLPPAASVVPQLVVPQQHHDVAHAIQADRTRPELLGKGHQRRVVVLLRHLQAPHPLVDRQRWVVVVVARPLGAARRPSAVAAARVGAGPASL
eukprot:IDg22959t1